ncbi:DEDDh family exonuclease [Nocardia asteroides]|uniref:DEDDh family exonuclease n=1 Tax=Nocardia asteroides TaxID=1824 RepID=UPI003662E570
MQGLTRLDEQQQAAGFGEFTVVDVETSGLQPQRHRVLSVAALTLDSTGQVSREFHTLVDPGCDPGPVHIHGLTAEILRGAPRFAQVREQLSAMLTGRVLVAHNAVFDFGFLAGEFRRAGAELPVRTRLCTLALARRVGLPTPDYTLGTLAAYYGVPQQKAHDALDDTRVLAHVLRALVADAARLGIAPPLLPCVPTAHDPARTAWPVERRGAKQPCSYAYPGRWEPGTPLRCGMKVAFTGETVVDREDLVSRAEAAGLDVTGAVSGRTSLLVTNAPDSGTGKARTAIGFGTPVIDEARFLELLATIEPGTPKQAGTSTPVSRAPEPSAPASRRPGPKPAGPLSGHRVLVLGGTHEEAAATRTRIVELGGSAAVNLSATVTDLLLLAGADTDRRLRKATDLGLPVHGLALLERTATAPAASEPASPEPAVLARGQVIDLPGEAESWTVRATWNQFGTTAVDLVAFLVDGNEKVRDSDDFVFYNQPVADGARLSQEGPTEQSVTLALDDLPGDCVRVVVAAALDGAGTFGEVGAVELELAAGLESGAAVRATLDAATVERTLLLAELYLRGETWRVRAVGQGYEFGLAELARRYGVEVE